MRTKKNWNVIEASVRKCVRHYNFSCFCGTKLLVPEKEVPEIFFPITKKRVSFRGSGLPTQLHRSRPIIRHEFEVGWWLEPVKLDLHNRFNSQLQKTIFTGFRRSKLILENFEHKNGGRWDLKPIFAESNSFSKCQQTWPHNLNIVTLRGNDHHIMSLLNVRTSKLI